MAALSALASTIAAAAAPLLQGEELEPARAKAEAAGVKDIFIDDLREEFVRDFVFPMFRCVLGWLLGAAGAVGDLG